MEKRREGSWLFGGRRADGWWDRGGQVETGELLKGAARMKRRNSLVVVFLRINLVGFFCLY